MSTNDVTAAVSSSLDALTQQYRTITHNIANSNTAGYKRRRSVFEETLRQQTAGGAPESAVDSTAAVDFSQGRFVQTDRSLDLALDGKGFFVIETPEGPIYTRNGTFRINERRQMVDFAGRIVSGQNGPIILPAGQSALSVRISQDGTVSSGEQTLGRLRIVEFEKPDDLTPASGTGYLAPEDLEPLPAEQAVVHQGFQESANVSVVEELVSLIAVSRMYEANLKTVRSQDQRGKHLLNVAVS